MAPQHVAALGASAGCLGAALAAKVAVLGLVQIPSVALEDYELEDQTEAEWATVKRAVESRGSSVEGKAAFFGGDIHMRGQPNPRRFASHYKSLHQRPLRALCRV